MIERVMKRYLPRSLFWRLVLILLVPIIVIQIIVGYVFTDRIYRDITVQLTQTAAIDIEYLLSEINAAPDPKTAKGIARGLGRELKIVTRLTDQGDTSWQTNTLFYDISGRQLIETLQASIPAIEAVDLVSNFRSVILRGSTAHGPVEMQFSRRRASASNPHQVLVVMVMASVLMTTAAFLFMKNQIRAISRLAEASEAFGRGQSIPFHAQGATEVWSAGHAFLSMRKRIENHIEQRTMMLSGVSHDLRTPLTRMKLGLSLMEEGDARAALEQDVDEMEGMLDSFLTFAQGEPDGRFEETKIIAFVSDIEDRCKRAGQDISLKIVGQKNADATMTCNPQTLRRAIDNLISNAVRVADIVQFTVMIGPKNVEFRIEDSGPGIPKDRREAALRPFTKLDEARNQNRGGTAGLGLAIAADIARAHGGALTLAQSPSLGGLKAAIRAPR